MALVAAIATALSQENEAAPISVGPLGADVPLKLAFTAGIGLAVVRGLLQLLLAYMPARMSANAMLTMRRKLFDSFLGSSWGLKATQRDGYFQSLMNAHVTASAQGVILLSTGLAAGLMFVSMVVSAFFLSAWTAMLIFSLSLALFAVLRPLSKRLRRRADELSRETVEYSKGVQEVVLVAEEVEVFGASRRYRESFYALIERVRRPLQRTRFMSKAVPALYQSVALLVLVLALAVVAALPAAGLATLGAVVLILLRSLTYGQQLQAASSGLDETMPFVRRLVDAIEEYRANARSDGIESLPPIEVIGMRRVTFKYPSGPAVLHELDFEVRRGESIGVVGPSGSGKSSFVQLLLRLRDPSAGAVVVNGRDVANFRRREWQKKIAYVPQTPQVLWGTVTENIRFYRDAISQEQVEQAARLANIHDEIMSWRNGYDTVIGQRASGISGGQRQRLCIARALAGSPEMVVLDEATSALDVRSEALIQETLTALHGKVTLFVVAHRLSTLSFCDRILVLVDGRIQGLDRPERLMEENDFYREVTLISHGAIEENASDHSVSRPAGAG